MDSDANTKIKGEPATRMEDGSLIDEVKEQFTLQAFLRDAPFPATKEVLMGYAMGRKCTPEILGYIQSLPDSVVFDNTRQLQSAIQGAHLNPNDPRFNYAAGPEGPAPEDE